MQETRQQLQDSQQTLQAEVQDLDAQISTLEIKLAAEPAKQRVLALKVCFNLAYTVLSTPRLLLVSCVALPSQSSGASLDVRSSQQHEPYLLLVLHPPVTGVLPHHARISRQQPCWQQP